MANNWDIGFGYGSPSGSSGSSPFGQYGSQGSPFGTGSNYSLGNLGLTYSSPTYNPMEFDLSKQKERTDALQKDAPGGAKTTSGGWSSDQWNMMGSGLSSMGAGLADVIGAKDRMLEQQGLADAAKGDIDKFWEQYKGGEFDAKLDQKMLDYFSMGRRGTDLTPTLSAMATGLDVASQDPRMMAASLTGMTSSASKSMQDIARQDFERELGMAQQEGQAYQGIRDQNLAFKQGLYQDKLAQDQLAYQTALDNKAKMDEARRQGWGDIAGGAMNMVGSFFAKDGGVIPRFEGGGDVLAQIMAAQGQGGVPPRQDLPGPESHEANPIDMVAPNGEKVGEATGGEIILNSEQTENIEEAVAVVDQAIESGEQPSMDQLMAVYESVSETLSQPQFQDEQQAPKADEARQRMMMM